MTADDVRKMLFSACERIGSQRAWARLHAIDVGYVNRVLQGQKEPSDTICKALGLKRHIVYRLRTEKRK